MPITVASRVSSLSTPSSSAVKIAQRFTLQVPSDREGEALSSMRGLAGTALPDVELRVGKRVPFGMTTTIEIVATGSSTDLASLRALMASAVDPKVSAPSAVDIAETRRFLAIDSPTLPKPTPDQGELGAMELRVRYLMGEYAGPGSDVLGRRSAPDALMQLPIYGDHGI